MRVNISLNRTNKFIILLSLLMIVFIVVASIELTGEISQFKDYHMDSQFMNAIRHFGIDGYKTTKCKSILMGGELNHPDSHFYNNFPNFHFLFYALFFKAGITKIVYYRYISMLISSVAIICLLIIIQKLTSNIFIVTLSVIILLFSHQFHFYLDHLWLAPYTMLFSWAPAALYLIGRDTSKLVRSTCFLFIVSILFIQLQVTFDAVMYSYVLILSLHFYLCKSRNLWRLHHIIIFSLSIVMGFLFQVFWKTIIAGGNTLNVSLMKSNMYNIASMDFYKSVYYFFHPTMLILWVISFFSIYVLRKFGGDLGKEIIRISAILFICGMLWFLIFPQHALHHSYLYTRMVMPSLALLSSAGIYIIFGQKELGKKLAIVFLLVLFVILNLNETIFRNNLNAKYDLSLYREIAPLVDNNKAVIYSNTQNVYPFSYYADRTFRYFSSHDDLNEDTEKQSVLNT